MSRSSRFSRDERAVSARQAGGFWRAAGLPFSVVELTFHGTRACRLLSLCYPRSLSARDRGHPNLWLGKR